MKVDGAPRIAVVTANANASNSYTLDWLEAFLESPMLEGTHIDLYRPGASGRLRKALREVDGTVLLHSATADDLQPLRSLKDLFNDRRGPVCVLVGNEINLPWAPLSEKIALMQQIGANLIGTQLIQEAGEYLYTSVTEAKVVSVPHAGDRGMLRPPKNPAFAGQVLGTRSARYLPILGDEERESYFGAVSELAADRGWRVDISEERLGRDAWREFLAGLDVTVGTEAGSWFTSPSDDVVNAILAAARQRHRGPSVKVDGAIRRMTRRIPWSVRQRLRRSPLSQALPNDLDLLAQLDYLETYEEFFAQVPRPKAYMKAISSRHVEAAFLGVPQMLLRGRYNDILEAERDYIAVEPDLSNLAAALAKMADPTLRHQVAQSAQATVESAHSLQSRILYLLRELDAEWA